MGKLFLLTGYFVITPVILLFTILFFSFLTFHKYKSNWTISIFSPTKSVAYAALPSNQKAFTEYIVQTDARVEMIRQFFAKYQSPLEPYAEKVVETADNYGIDFRLIPSIAMQESNLCKKMPEESYNCWGFGIYGGKITKFENFDQAIETVTKSLAKNYKGQGLETPEEIMSRYTPSNNGSWARAVNHFMNKLQ